MQICITLVWDQMVWDELIWKFFSLIAILPPDNNVDFDLHLERTVRDLQDLRTELLADVVLLYCSKDVPEEGSKQISPEKIKADVEKDGYRV